MLKFGYITELNLAEGTVRVNFTEDGIVSNPLQVSVQASKEDKYSFPFVINEHVWCLMDKNCEFGVVGGALYDQKIAPPADAGEQKIIVNINGDKLKLSIDRSNGNVKIESEGFLNLDFGGDVSIDSDGKITIQNSQVNIKELLQLLKDFIEKIKVNTPVGPSAGLIMPLPVELVDFQTKLDQLLN